MKKILNAVKLLLVNLVYVKLERIIFNNLLSKKENNTDNVWNFKLELEARSFLPLLSAVAIN